MNYPQVSLILLAAGESRRMGTPKQLLPYKETSLIRHAATVAVTSQCNPIIVVLGANSDRIVPELNNLPVHICQNPNWKTGMSSSISLGIKTLVTIQSNIDAAIVALADQPLITATVYNKLIELYLETKQKAVASTYANTIGVPALFDRLIFPELLQTKYQGGAKQLLNKYNNRAFNLNVPEAAIDIDTPTDYQKLLK